MKSKSLKSVELGLFFPPDFLRLLDAARSTEASELFALFLDECPSDVCLFLDTEDDEEYPSELCRFLDIEDGKECPAVLCLFLDKEDDEEDRDNPLGFELLERCDLELLVLRISSTLSRRFPFDFVFSLSVTTDSRAETLCSDVDCSRCFPFFLVVEGLSLSSGLGVALARTPPSSSVNELSLLWPRRLAELVEDRRCFESLRPSRRLREEENSPYSCCLVSASDFSDSWRCRFLASFASSSGSESSSLSEALSCARLSAQLTRFALLWLAERRFFMAVRLGVFGVAGGTAVEVVLLLYDSTLSASDSWLAPTCSSGSMLLRLLLDADVVPFDPRELGILSSSASSLGMLAAWEACDFRCGLSSFFFRRDSVFSRSCFFSWASSSSNSCCSFSSSSLSFFARLPFLAFLPARSFCSASCRCSSRFFWAFSSLARCFSSSRSISSCSSRSLSFSSVFSRAFSCERRHQTIGINRFPMPSNMIASK